MRRYAKRYWMLAATMAMLAGYVDAIGFLTLGGFFVSFMSGNSTRLAVGFAEGSGGAALLAGGLVAAFVSGVVCGSLGAHAAGGRRKPAVLVLVAALLGGAALLDGWVGGHGSAFAMAGAMGAANCVFQRGGEVTIGVTYMTGTLVKLGQHLASAFCGGERFNWLPYLLLWAGLVCGAVAGAALYPLVGAASLWIAAAAAATLALGAFVLGPVEPVEPAAA